MSLAKLLADAKEAKPDLKPCRSKWAQVYPAFIQLRQNGFSRRDAVKWLIDKGAVTNATVDKGVRALDSLALRRKGKQ